MGERLRITTWNVNGMRSALRKEFPKRLADLAPDVLLLQEVRSRPEQLDAAWRSPEGWNVVWHPAERAGYAGTAVWSRWPLAEVGRGLNGEDVDGRVLAVRTAGVLVVSVYLPSGSSSPEAQARKDVWMPNFLEWSRALAAADEPVLMGGDLNVAHTEQDIWNPKGNAKNSGFLPHERRWFGELLGVGWRDVLREAVGSVKGPYSWWSNRGEARALDRGWRIDYLLANRALTQRMEVLGAHVDREAGLAVGDHAPVSVDLWPKRQVGGSLP